MLKNVLALVRPNNSSLAFERTNMSANLNLKSRAPSAPTPAAPLPNPDPCFAPAGPASSERLNAAIRAETTWCWVASAGSRSSAWRQAARAALGSPACSAPSAVAARRLSSSACTRRRQEGQASRAGAICVPHCAHTDGARPGTSASVIYEGLRRCGASGGLVRPCDLQGDAPVELPRLVQREPRDQQVDRARDADHYRSRIRERDDHREAKGDSGQARARRRTGRGVAGRADAGGDRGGRGGPGAPFLLQLAGDQRGVGHHDGGVGEKHGDQLVARAAT